MESRKRSRIHCQCARSLPTISSSLLFLAAILPNSSFAQVLTDDPAQSSARTTPPTTLQTSASPTETPGPSTPPPTPTQSNPAAVSTSSTNDNDYGPTHDFNYYYFVVIAIVALIFCLCILYIGRRKKRKAALNRAHSQRALARDVEGFRTRFRGGRTGTSWGLGYNGGHGADADGRDEGLDERGEAPPPYVPGSKPPSIRSGNGIERPGSSRSVVRAQEDVELGDFSRPENNDPPGYHEHHTEVSQDADAGIARPETAVTAQERFGSTRSLLRSQGGLSQA